MQYSPFLRQLIFFIIWVLFLSACVRSEYNVGSRTQDVYFYSTQREINMGRNIAKAIEREFEISNNPYDIERISKIRKKIIPYVDRQELNYFFYVIEADEKGQGQVNAFSLPGGYIYIFKDLLDMLDEEELAFVLAHEVGHVVSRHHIKRLQAAMGYNLLTLASVGASADPEFTKGLSFALAQIIVAHSRKDEFNADELAVKYTKRAGYDPKAGIELLEKLYQEHKDKIRPLSYFRTHPFTAQRIRHIKESLHLPLDVEDYLNF